MDGEIFRMSNRAGRKTFVAPPPYQPRGIQWELYNLKTRFTIARVGRQWGKSMITMLKNVKERSHAGGIYWWVLPTIPQSKVHMRRMIKYFKPFIKRINRTDREIEFIEGDNFGGTWYFKGADDPENLEGETLDGCVMDEAARMAPEVWHQTIRPMLAVKKGWADFIGKPRGNNWYKRLWVNAESHPDWSRFHAKSNSSPFFSEEEYQEAKADTPTHIFAQEYDAEFVDNTGTVIRNIDNVTRGELQPPDKSKNYFAGVDLAKTTDYTVICILDQEKNLVAFERMQNIAWTMQKARIKNLCHKYRANVLIDSTGLGDPIFDDLATTGLKISGYKFTNASKRVLIENLILTFEHELISIPNIPVMINELKNFEITTTRTGLITYSAPPGLHDDCVTALALANYYCIGMTGPLIETGGSRMTADMYQ